MTELGYDSTRIVGISKSAGLRNLEVTTGSVQFNRSTAAALTHVIRIDC